MRCPVARFPIWKTVTFGGVPTSELVTKLREAGIEWLYENRWVELIIERSTFNPPRAVTADLSLVRVVEMGLTRPTMEEIIAWTDRHYSLWPMPVVAVPSLRLAYPEQHEDEIFYVGMFPQTGCGGWEYIFQIRRSGGANTIGTYQLKDYAFYQDDIFVFLNGPAR